MKKLFTNLDKSVIFMLGAFTASAIFMLISGVLIEKEMVTVDILKPGRIIIDGEYYNINKLEDCNKQLQENTDVNVKENTREKISST